VPGKNGKGIRAALITCGDGASHMGNPSSIWHFSLPGDRSSLSLFGIARPPGDVIFRSTNRTNRETGRSQLPSRKESMTTMYTESWLPKWQRPHAADPRGVAVRGARPDNGT